LQQANSCDALTCPLRIDALPEPGSVHKLHELGRDPTGKELLPAGSVTLTRGEPQTR
jgi:hypothetical protein